jgi:hypothetical protein
MKATKTNKPTKSTLKSKRDIYNNNNDTLQPKHMYIHYTYITSNTHQTKNLQL